MVRKLILSGSNWTLELSSRYSAQPSCAWPHLLHLGGSALSVFQSYSNRNRFDIEAKVSSSAIIPHTVGLGIGSTAIVDDAVVLMPHMVPGGSWIYLTKAIDIPIYKQEQLPAQVQNYSVR